MGTVPARRRALEWPRTLSDFTFLYVFTTKFEYKRELLDEESLKHSIPISLGRQSVLSDPIFSVTLLSKIEVLLSIVWEGPFAFLLGVLVVGRIRFSGLVLDVPNSPLCF